MATSVLKQVKENDREARRKLTIDAAKKLFNDKSFHEIGMRDIASKAGIPVSSLYHHFLGQDDLFLEVLMTDIRYIGHRLRNGQKDLEETAVEIVNFLIENEAIFQVMEHFMLKGGKNSNTFNRFNMVHTLFLDILDKALSRSGESNNVEGYSHAFFASLFGNVITFKSYPSKQRESYRQNICHATRATAQTFREALISESSIT